MRRAPRCEGHPVVAWDMHLRRTSARSAHRRQAGLRRSIPMSERTSTAQAPAVASAPTRRVRQGPVMPIGGAEKKGGDGDETILTRFVELAGGSSARIAVIPTASEEAAEAGERYVKVFSKLGAADTEWLRV